MDIKNEEAIRTCIENFHHNIKKYGYHDIIMRGPEHFKDKRCMINLLQLACMAQGLTVPFITNHKLFYDDPSFSPKVQNTLEILDVAHFLVLALVEGHEYMANRYSRIYSYNDFEAKIKSDKPISSISSNDLIANYILDRCRYDFRKANTGYFYYYLYCLLVLKFLIKREKNIDFSLALDEKYCDYLCSVSLCLPEEGNVTLHYFVYSYLMSDEQRRENNPAYERALQMKCGTYSFSDLVDVLYQGGKKLNYDLKEHFVNFYRKAYKVVNLDFNTKSEKIDYQDIILIIIWKMLYRDTRKNNTNSDTVYADDLLNFYKIIKESFNFLKLFEIESLDKVEDTFTLLEPNRSNKYNVFFTLINNVPTKYTYKGGYVENFEGILDTLRKFGRPEKVKDYEKLLEFNLKDSLEHVKGKTNKIIDEFKDKILYFDFVTGLSTQIQIYCDIKNAYDVFEPMAESVAKYDYEEYYYWEIDEEFIRNHDMWEILSDDPLNETPEAVKKLTKNLIDSLKTFYNTMEMISCEKKMALSQYSALLWLIRHGTEIKITFPKSYQNNNAAEIPKNLSTIFKNMKESDKRNKWFSLLVISNFLDEFTQYNLCPGSHFDLQNNLVYNTTYKIVKNYCDHLPPSQAMAAISETFSKVDEQLKKPYVRNVWEYSERSPLTTIIVGTLVKNFGKRLLKIAGLVEHFFDFLHEVAVTQEQVNVLSGNAYVEVL